MNRYLAGALLLIMLPLSIGAEMEGEGEPRSPEEYYRAGRYEEAAVLYLAQADHGNRVVSYYNASRSYHEDYREDGALESLQKAVDGYYRVLDLDADHEKTLFNLELARLELEKQNRESGEQQNQQQKEEERPSDTREGQMGEESLDRLAAQQRDLSRSGQGEENREKQSELTEQTKEARESSAHESQAGDYLDQALEKQKEALESMDQGSFEDAARAQRQAASLLEQAAAANAEEAGDDENALPQSIQSILNSEEARNRDKQDKEDMMRVEKNW